MLSGKQLQTLFETAGIAPQSTIHRGATVVVLRYPKERTEITAAIRKEGGRWSSTLNGWYVPRKVELLERILSHLGYGLSQVHPSGAAALEQMERQIDLKGYSPATKKNYSYAFRSFICYYPELSPEDISRTQIEDYLLWLSKEHGYSESAVHTAMNAIKFYYEAVLRRPKQWFQVYRPKKPQQNPRFFSKEEVTAIINHTDNLKHKVMLMLCYSAGLRVSEVVGLKVRHIDSNRKCIYIEGAKGKKDRVAPLSTTLLVMLRAYYRQYKPKEYLFEGALSGQPYSTRSLQQVLHTAKERAGVIKPGSIHALRHSFATHLLDKGTDVVMIQKLLGHNDIKTTLRYLHVTNRDIIDIGSPLDDLEL